MNKVASFLLVLFYCSSLEAQVVKLGFRVEPNIIISEKSGASSIILAPLSLHSTILIEPVNNFILDARAGYIFANEYYTGIEFGIYIRYALTSRFLIIAGVNNHSNSGGAHNSGGAITKDIFFKGIGIGFQVDSKISFDFMYSWTSDGEYAYYRDTDWLTYSKTLKKRINGIIKIGFCIAWDII